MGDNRKALIEQACRELLSLDDQIAALQKDRTAVKNKIVKGELGMKVADFNIALRVYRLEGPDRTTLFDTMKETFAALGVGEQSNFLDAIGAEKTVVAPATPAPAPAKKARKKNPTPEELGEKPNPAPTFTTSDAEFAAAAPTPDPKPDEPEEPDAVENDDDFPPQGDGSEPAPEPETMASDSEEEIPSFLDRRSEIELAK